MCREPDFQSESLPAEPSWQMMSKVVTFFLRLFLRNTPRRNIEFRVK